MNNNIYSLYISLIPKGFSLIIFLIPWDEKIKKEENKRCTFLLAVL